MKTARALLISTSLTIIFSLLSLPTWAINGNPNQLWKSSSPTGPALYKLAWIIEDRGELQEYMESRTSIKHNMGQLYKRVLEERAGEWVAFGLEIDAQSAIYVDGPGALQVIGMFNGGRDSLLVDSDIVVSEDPQQKKIFSTAVGQVMIHKDLYTVESEANNGKKLVLVYMHLPDCRNIQEVREIRPTAKWREG